MSNNKAKIPFGGAKSANTAQEETNVETQDEVSLDDLKSPEEIAAALDQAPEAQLTVHTPVAVQPVLPSEEARVKIRPRVDIPRASIGGVWYSFRKGHEQYVPADVARHLEERDLI